MAVVEHFTHSVADYERNAEGRMEEDAPPGAEHPISILVVEDEGIVARDLTESLQRLGYHIVGVASEGAEAVSLAASEHPELVVMDVTLRGDIDGIQAARLIQERSPVPVIFLTGHSDPATLRRAVTTGPLGYILKPFQEVELRCAIEVAIHKHRADLAIKQQQEHLQRSAERIEKLSLIDDLTQLKNRRGFFELAAQALKVARREQHQLALFFMDLNGLKQINDTFGHLVGDQALQDTASVLRQTFREADILGRLGGDEFVALAHVNRSDVGAVRRRLHAHLDEFNAENNRDYSLELSIGAALVDPQREEKIEALIERADAAMYEEKRAAHGA